LGLSLFSKYCTDLSNLVSIAELLSI